MKKKKILLGLGSFAILGLATVLASCDGEKTYTVTFYNGTTEVTTQTVTGGYNAEVPTAPTKEGSKFNGWYADEALTTAFDFGSIIEGDTAVYAGWVNESAVVFKDGSTTLSTQTVLNGSNAKVPTAPTATGKRFNGWYKDAACTQAFDFGSVITTGTTVYAGWVDQYTVTFKDGGRTLSTVTVEDGNLVDIPTAPTKDNKVFAGWFTDQTYTTAYDFGSPVTSSKSVYAKWDSVYYTVSLYIDANTKWKDVQVESEEVLPTDLAPTKNYSVWDGKWYTDAACTQQFVTSTAITGATTLYAGWNVETENVTYSFDYTPLLAAYPGKTKPATIVNSGIFYLESGMYFEDSYANQTDSSKANDPDFNTQKKVFWWTVKTGGKLSFDWKDRGSTTKFTIYRIPAVSTNSEVPTYSDDDVVYNKTTSTLTSHFEYDCTEAGTYIFVADGSIMVQQLQCSDVVEKSAPVSISVAGARNQFLVGADFESTGLSCTLNYANGSTESVSAASTATDDKTGFVVDYSEVNFNEEGTYTVNVTYTAHDTYGDYPFTTSYDINVYAVDSIEAFTFGLDSSRNTQHNQLVYAVGDTVKTDKVYVHAYGEIGESAYDEQLTNEFTFNTVDTSTTGKKAVTATYTKDTTKTSSFDVQVVEKVFDKDTVFATVYVDANLEDKVAKKVAFNEYTYSEYTEGSSASYVFASVTEALQYLQLCEVSDDATKVLVLADGVYNEKVFVDMPNVTILGSTSSTTNNGSNSGAVITFNAMNGITAPNGASYSTDGAASFTISKKATNCLVSNVTLSNYYNTHERYVESQKITSSTQATSVLVRGDMARFYNVSFSGYHDTLYADQGRQYYNNCYIEGRTDYIFGSDATAYFTNCTIKTLGAGLTEKNGGYVVATKGTSGLKYGYVFNNCTFTADDQTQAGCVSIARGWDVNMTVMVMNCNIDNHFSKGTYGQGYYEKTFADQEAFTAALATGVYTYDAEASKYVKLATTAELDSTATYYVQLNDRYTKMNADPKASLLFEYNNTGDGAIAYDADLAAKYAVKTFTLMNPEDATDQATAAKYADLNTVFAASNNGYTENWNPTGSYVTINYDGVTSENCNEVKISLAHAYVDNTLVASQINTIKSTIKKALKDGYTLIGLYTDAAYKTEFTTETKLTSVTTIYVRIIEGTLEERTMAYSQANETNEGWTVDGLSTTYNTISATPGKSVFKQDGNPAISGAESFEDGIVTYLAPKAATFKSPTITEAGVKEIQVQIYGGTHDTNDPVEIKITAYNAAGTAIGSTLASGMGDSSTNGKRSGYASLTKNGSQKSEYITVIATEDISYFVVSFTGNKFGGSAITKSYGITSIDAKYEVVVKAETVTQTDEYALDLTSETLTTAYAAKSGKSYLAQGALPGNDWLTLQGKLSQKSTGATENDLTSTAFYCASAGTIASLELDKASNTNATTKLPGALSFTTKGKATLTVKFTTNGGKTKEWNAVNLAVGTYVLGSDNKLTYTYLTAKSATNCTGDKGNYAYDTTMENNNVATLVYEIEEAGTYYILNPGSRAVRITGVELADSYQVPASGNKITTSTSNAKLNFQDTSTLDSTVFDISGATISSTTNEGTDYASNKVIGDVKVTVKKGAVVYVSAYYNQDPSAVEYTITANGKTSEKLSANSYVVATEDQTITITGSGNNYLQEILVAYPLAEGKSLVFSTTGTNPTYPEGKTFQYSAYDVDGIILDGSASGNTAKISSRVNEQWGQFTKAAKFVVVLQKGQTVKAKTYNGDATMTYSVLGGEATSVENAGAQKETSFTATADYTVVVITAVSNDYVEYVVVE